MHLLLARRDLFCFVSSVARKDKAVSLTGWVDGGQLRSEGGATLPRKPNGVGSLFTSCRLALLSGLVGEAAEGGRGKNTTGESVRSCTQGVEGA